MARVIIAVAPCPLEVSISDVARKSLMVYLRELGLTPVGTSRVHPLQVAKKQPRDRIPFYFSNPDTTKPSA
ncbi:MAG: hypothetical protein E6K66_07085 [Nitrospirae bacterium]|nr:MAG: hypothetical protein E6K66_07085 [Nitrospirota bacterium]